MLTSCSVHESCINDNTIYKHIYNYIHVSLLAHYDTHKAFFPQGFRYEPSAFSRFLLMRKGDGVVFATIPIAPMFVTHQVKQQYIMLTCNLINPNRTHDHVF